METIGIIIPAYNEEEGLSIVLGKLFHVLEETRPLNSEPGTSNVEQ